MLREGFYVLPSKTKKFDKVDIVNDTSRHLSDILTIDNNDFGKHISCIYPAELQLNKANSCKKKKDLLSYKDLNIKVIDDDINTRI